MNLANWITLIRIALVPVLVVFWHVLGWEWTLGVFLAAAITDSLDGKVARKYGLITTLGKFLDPLADKLLTITALVMLTAAGTVPAWCTSLIVAREFIVTSLRVVAMGEGRAIAATMSGKVKMVVQVVCISVLICAPLAGLNFGVSIADISVWLMTAVTVWSGADYLLKNRDVFKS